MGTHPIFESDFDCLTAFSEMSYYTIWMGDLPPDCRREHVIKFFEGYGTLGGIRLMNNFGFVDFKHKRDAKDAVKDLNGEKLRGARIRLEMSDGPGNRKSGTSYEETAAFSTMREERGFNPRFERPYRTKYGMAVSNLTKKFSWSDLKNFMRQAGEVTYTDAHIRSGEHRGEVCFKNRKGLYTAKKKLDRTKLHGRRIRLKIIEDGSRAVGTHKHHSSRTPEKKRGRSGSRSSSGSRSRSRSSSGSRSRSRSSSRSRSRTRTRSRTPEDKKKRGRSKERSRSPEKKKSKKRAKSRSRSRSSGEDERRKRK